MKNFQLLEDYKVQGKADQESRRKYDEKVAEAEQALTDAKIKLDEVVHAEISTGTEKKTEKTAARKAIEQAEKDVAYAKEEQSIANAHFTGKRDGDITPGQIVQAYLTEYAPSVKADHLPEIQARIKQGGDLLLSALHDFAQLRREYHDIKETIKSVNDAAVRSGEQSSSYYIANPFDDLSDSGIDINKLAYQLQTIDGGGKLPDGATYIEKAFVPEEATTKEAK